MTLLDDIKALLDNDGLGTTFEWYDDEQYISVPMGYMEAVEVEGDDNGVSVNYRKWDVTGGLTEDDVLVTFTGNVDLAPVVRRFINGYINGIKVEREMQEAQY